MPLRIQVVDDFEPWLRFVSNTFEKRDLQIVLEVKDGLEAVYKAERLRPDLILLDVGLPTLDGIKAARRIRDVAPNSKILFLTEQTCPDIAQAALDAGGAGYVVKSDAGRELLTAVNALRNGKRYIGPRLVGQVFFSSLDGGPPEHCNSHELQAYSSDDSFVDGFADFIVGNLTAGNAVVVVATETHRQGLSQKLETHGFNLNAMTKSGTYVPLDVQKTLASFLLDDQPDPVRFWKVVSNLLETTSQAPNRAKRRVCACGEMAPVLWREGKPEAALRVEQLWEEACRKYGIKTLCGYLSGTLQSEKDHATFQTICGVHSTVNS